MQTLAVPDGSTVLRIPDGAASIKYTLTVQARYQKSDGSLKNLTFTYVLRYSGDVSLELRYTLLNGTQTAIRCANGQNKTAQTVYSDEVTDGVLAYTLALTGGTVVIDHGCGVKSYLFGLDAVKVQRGQSLARGEELGATSEEHTLIWELRIGSKSVDPAAALTGSSGLLYRETM